MAKFDVDDLVRAIDDDMFKKFGSGKVTTSSFGSEPGYHMVRWTNTGASSTMRADQLVSMEEARKSEAGSLRFKRGDEVVTTDFVYNKHPTDSMEAVAAGYRGTVNHGMVEKNGDELYEVDTWDGHKVGISGRRLAFANEDGSTFKAKSIAGATSKLVRLMRRWEGLFMKETTPEQIDKLIAPIDAGMLPSTGLSEPPINLDNHTNDPIGMNIIAVNLMLLARYAAFKAVAMRFRESGDIRIASEFETQAQVEYNKLSSDWQW